MTERLQISTAMSDGNLVVSVHGEVDMDSSPRLLAEIKAGLRQSHSLVIELADVSYMDSSGVAVLVQGLRTARKLGLGFTLRAPSKPVTAVLSLAHLLQLFTVDGPGTTGG